MKKTVGLQRHNNEHEMFAADAFELRIGTIIII